MNKSDRAPLLLPAYPHRHVNLHEALRHDALTSVTRASHVRDMVDLSPCRKEPALVHCETREISRAAS